MTTRIYQLFCEVAEVVHAICPEQLLACFVLFSLTPQIVSMVTQKQIQSSQDLLFTYCLAELFAAMKSRAVYIKTQFRHITEHLGSLNHPTNYF